MQDVGLVHQAGTSLPGVPGREALVADGPYAATDESVGSWFVVEAEDLDVALEVAARVPAGRLGGAVEIRPVPTSW